MGKLPQLISVTRLDSIKLDESYFTDEGFFIDTPIVTRIGIFEYKNHDGSIRRELRLPEHVFSLESLASYEGKPVIITHAAQRVNTNNVDDEIVGTILTKGYQDGENVRTKVVIHDINSVKKSGLRELSLGYDQQLIEAPGIWEGQAYDAIQTNIKVNHLALVRDARAGDKARLNLDSLQTLKGATKMGAKKRKPMNGEQLIAALEAQMGRRADSKELAIINEVVKLDNADATQKTETNSDAEMKVAQGDKIKTIKENLDKRKDTAPPKEGTADLTKQQDSDIADLLEIIECLQAKMDFNNASSDKADATSKKSDKKTESATVNADSMDAIVTERLKLARLGDKLNLDGLENMKPLDAKIAIVKAVNPNMRLDGKSDMYVQAAFDLAVEQANAVKDVDYQRMQMSQRMDTAGMTEKSGAMEARKKMIERYQNGGNDDANAK